MQCTQCQSDNVQSLRVIYETGTQEVNTKSKTVGSGFGGGSSGVGGGFGTANTSTTGTQQSILARKVAPPEKKSYIPSVLILAVSLAVTVLFSLPFILLILALPLAGFLSYRVYKYNDEQFPSLYNKWSKSWHCNKCGEIYFM